MENNKLDVLNDVELNDDLLDAVAGGAAVGDTAEMYCARDCKTKRVFVYGNDGHWRCSCCGLTRGSINVFA